MNKIFITGASGFIGQAVCKAFIDLKYSVCGTVRNKDIISQLPKVKYVSTGDISSYLDWKDVLAGYDCVIHCAGIAEEKNNSIYKNIYDHINTEATVRLAEHCVIVGVKKFIFLSSISVLGNNNYHNEPFKYSSKCNPLGAYAQSKYKAEKKLLEISAKTSLDVTIIRPPIVYGLGAKGNIIRVIKFLKLRLPLPFGLIKNKKSFISVDNLVDLIICCIKHPNLKSEVFLISDGEDISLNKFLRKIANEIGYRLLIFPFPIFLLKLIAFFFGKSNEINKLLSNLQIDINYTIDKLNWKPPQKSKDGIRKMIKDK
jgi:nucleoside-diphosphate-sugar epimerase